MDLDFLPAGTMDQYVLNLLRILLERRVQAEMVFLRQRIENRAREAALLLRRLPAHHNDGAVIDGKRPVRNHQIQVEFHAVAQARALRAGAEGIVEGKAARFDLLDADAAVRAGEMLAEMQRLGLRRALGCAIPLLLWSLHLHVHQAVSLGKRLLQRFGQALLNALLHHQAVHEDLDVVLDVLVERDVLGQLVKISIDAHPHKAALFRMLQQLFMTALLAAHHRGEQLQTRALRQFHQLVHHLVHRLLHDGLAAVRTVRDADPRVQQAEIVIDLGDRPHGRARVAVG